MFNLNGFVRNSIDEQFMELEKSMSLAYKVQRFRSWKDSLKIKLVMVIKYNYTEVWLCNLCYFDLKNLTEDW